MKQGTFITPTGLFLVSMAIMYLVTAILHPQEFTMIIYGLMYFICIPSGYLLLTIYSLVNMHIVSWGTRESSKAKETTKTKGTLCDRTCKLCCWDMHCQVTQDTESLVLQQMQQAVALRTNLAGQVNDTASRPQNDNLFETELKMISSSGVGEDLSDLESEKRYSLTLL